MSDEGITINSTRYSPEAVDLMAGRIAELEKANASLHQTVLYWNERAGENYDDMTRSRKWSKRWKENARFWRHGYRDWRSIADRQGEELVTLRREVERLNALCDLRNAVISDLRAQQDGLLCVMVCLDNDLARTQAWAKRWRQAAKKWRRIGAIHE